MRINITGNDSFQITDGADSLSTVWVPGPLRVKSMATVNGRELEIRPQGIWSDHFVVVDTSGRQLVKLEIGRRSKLIFLEADTGSVITTYLLHRTAIFGWCYELLTENRVSLAKFELDWSWRKLGDVAVMEPQVEMSREDFAELLTYVVFIAKTQKRRTGNP